MTQKMTLREAARVVLREHGPMHYQELAAAILSPRLAESSSATPAASLNAVLAVDIKRNGEQSPFVRVKPGVFGLRDMHEVQAGVPPANTEDLLNTVDDADRRVRIPLFPLYEGVRHLLRVWPGRARKQITGFWSTIVGLRGTPQNTVDWTAPDAWIPVRLEGEHRELAEAIWRVSGGAVNPRHTHGHWLLAMKYDLLSEGVDGVLELTTKGSDFLQHVDGDTVVAIDEAEGLTKLLSIVADNGPARAGALTDDWGDYLKRRSAFGTDSTIKDTLRRRLNNLLRLGYLPHPTRFGIA